MLGLLLAIWSLFTTPEEWAAARRHYREVLIVERVYVRNLLGGGYLAPWRFYLDTSVSGDGRLTHFHFEGCFLGSGYADGVWWGTVNGRFHVFAADLNDYSGRIYPIRRGIDP